MHGKNLRAALLGALFAGAFFRALPAQAMPLFAQRYRLQCGACHSVLPELNAFGEYFRRHGYRLPLPKHGTTGIALRYQMEYEQDPAAGSRRYTPGGVLLSNADIGAVSAFVHYSLGAGGGPGGLFLGYLTTYNAHTQSTYRLGLFELPLAQSPGQRLDDLAPYGYYSAHAGLNDLTLSAPRWGVQLQRTFGTYRIDAIVDDGEFKGAAYGGKPIDTGERTAPAAPEAGVFVRDQMTSDVTLGAEFLDGARRISPAGRPAFSDAYRRTGVLARIQRGKLQFQAEQWFGSDANSDGFGTQAFTGGGYARLKYYPSAHWYLGLRYDAFANPFITRDLVLYTAFHVTPHARLLLQEYAPTGGRAHFGAAVTVGAPWPPKL